MIQRLADIFYPTPLRKKWSPAIQPVFVEGGTVNTESTGTSDITSVIPGVGALNLGKAEDAAHASGDVGVEMLAVRQDALAVLAADGDYIPLVVDANGRLYIAPAPANSGIDIGDVDVTSIIPGVAAANLGKAEDALHVTGDTGVQTLAVRNDTRTSLCNADGDYAPQSLDDEGSTLVHVTSGNVPATWASVVISGNTSGDNELVALVGGQRIYIMAITLVGAGAVNVVLESGAAGPDLTGLMAIAAAGDSIIWPVAGRGWYARTDVGESLNMRLDGAVFVTGIVTYYTAP